MELITSDKILYLKKIANDIRKDTINMLHQAGSGHTAGSLDIIDILTYLYFHKLKHNPNNPSWAERDRLILSNGHVCPSLYTTLSYAGYISKDKLNSLRKFGSILQGHPHREFLPLMETSSGPLGSGLSQAVGMAIASHMDNGIESSQKIYCILSDAENNEGQTWEAAMLASKYKLDNLIIIIDRNHIQLSGQTEDIMPLESLADKWRSFNFHVLDIDGHDFKEIDKAIDQAFSIKFQPTVIIAYTIPGKGVKEFESYKWHGKVPNDKEIEIALRELEEIKLKSNV
jgi:transketolase